MARYAIIRKEAITYKSRERAEGLCLSFNETVRILNKQEEKELAWEWFKEGLATICDLGREKEAFEDIWKEKENG